MTESEDPDNQAPSSEDLVETGENIQKEMSQYIPAMNVSVPQVVEDEKPEIVSDQMLLGIYGEILDMSRQDRVEVSDLLNNFCEMVINGGDSSGASKEAIVNLVKIKMDAADKMTKIADLMTRVKLKDKDTFPRHFAAKQENTINIGDSGKKALLKHLNDVEKRKKKENQK